MKDRTGGRWGSERMEKGGCTASVAFPTLQPKANASASPESSAQAELPVMGVEKSGTTVDRSKKRGLKLVSFHHKANLTRTVADLFSLAQLIIYCVKYLNIRLKNSHALQSIIEFHLKTKRFH